MAAVGDYQWRAKGDLLPEKAHDGSLAVHVTVERCVIAPSTWEIIPNGHMIATLTKVQIDGCVNTADLKTLIEEQIDAEGKNIIQGDNTMQAMLALLPGGVWPSNDITNPITV